MKQEAALKDADWKDLHEIVLFGWGKQGKKIYETLRRQFRVCGIVDNDSAKQGTQVDGVTILSFQDAKPLLHQYNVIVTAAQHYYQSIRQQLMAEGLIEDADFIMYQKFVTEWYYRYRHQVNVLKTDVSLTGRCTLNCESCMQFLPYWEKEQRKDTPLEQLEADVRLYFECVDYLFDFDIVGGEPLLYPQLNEFLTFIGENYRDRIGYVGIITNGTISPKDETCELLRRYSMELSVSDYSDSLSYHHRIPEICQKMEDYGIPCHRNQHIDWFDFGFPNKRYHYEGAAAARHMACCNPIVHMLDHGKLYYCGMVWGAEKGRLFPAEEKACIDLQCVAQGELDRKAILTMMKGEIPGGYMEFCKTCGGFGIDNNNRVATAKQLPRRENMK